MHERIFVLDAIRSNRRRIILGVLVFFLVVLAELTAISLIFFRGRPFELERFAYIMLIALGITVVLMPLLYLAAHFTSRWAILRAFGTVEVPPAERRKIRHALEGVCLAAGVEPPEVKVIGMDGINALSVARGRDNGIILVSPRAVRELDHFELQALFAHEVFHITAHDTWLWMLGFAFTALLPFVLGLFVTISQSALEDPWGEGKVPDNAIADIMLSDAHTRALSTVIVGGAFFIGYVVLAVFWVPFLIAFFLLVLPRDREYLADVQAVLLTRYPETVISLLEKSAESRSRGLKHGGVFINHMLFDQPLVNPVGPASIPAGFFNIHPTESARIARIESMN